MCGNGGGRCCERRMPASSGDPISSALHMSLAGNKCPNLKNDDLDCKIIASSRRVLLSDVQFEPAGCYTNTVLDSLKSKYVLLTANGCDNDNKVEAKVRNGSKETIPVSESNSTSYGVSGSPKKLKTEVPIELPVPQRVLYPAEAIQLGWQSNPNIIGSGMVNLRNTCYLNSTLQALFHVPAFVNWILNDKIHTTKCEMMNGPSYSDCLICAVMKTLQWSQRNSGNSIKPVQIVNKLKLICKHFDYGHQEDAHEFLRYLIESMERSYLTIVQGSKLDNYSKETTPLNQIFGGYLRNEVTCLECRTVSTTFQHFQDLLLDIRTVSSVEDALEVYFGREELGEDEKAYRCDKCQRRVAATKRFSIQKAPNVLCIQLKRFGILGGKISKQVSLKERIDLSGHLHPTSKNSDLLSYKLVSLISHIGPSSSCGHYTAIASTPNGSFHLFDDSIVRPVPMHTVLSTNAYVILYEMEPSPKSRPVKPPPAFTLTSSSNGLSGKSMQNGLSSSSHSHNNQTLVLSPKPERSSTNSCASTQKHNTSFPIITSTPQRSGSPKQHKMLNGASSSSKSLVPYTPNESSDSESDNAAGYRSSKLSGVSKENKNVRSSPLNGLSKETVQKSLISCNNKKSIVLRESPSPTLKLNYIPSTSSAPASSPSKIAATSTASKNEKFIASSHLPIQLPPTNKKLSFINEPPPNLVVNGWQVSEALGSPNSSGGSSNGTGSSVGNWNVIDVSKSRVNEKVETVTTVEEEDATFIASPGQTAAMDRLSLNTSGDNGAVCRVDDNNNEQNDFNSCLSSSGTTNSNAVCNASNRNNSNKPEGAASKMWDGSRSNETVTELLKMSHRGYGASNVTTWSGEKCEIEKEVENDKNESKKRSISNLYEEDLDRGKVKKVKSYNYNGPSSRNGVSGNGRRYNSFQEHQNRKNAWYSGNNSKRHLFYRNYNNMDRIRTNHHNHNSSYHNQNGYRSWRH